MAALNKISRPVIPRKRPFDEADDCELDKVSNPRTIMSKYPPPKMRIGVKFVRDFPPGCGLIKQDPIGNQPQRIPFKTLDNINKDHELAVSHLKTIKPKQLGRSKSAGKVKFWDPNCDSVQKQKDTNTTTVNVSISPKEQVRREKIKEVMMMFDEVYTQLNLANKSKPKGERIACWRVPSDAAKIVNQKMKWRDAEKTLGSICGVQIGDKFNFRSQLQMVGLHCQPQSGIDYTKIRGKSLAISIVDSHRYSNERESSDVLFYCGQGGVRFLGSKQSLPEDQKLERGNLALKNSMNEKTPVRVIRKLHRGCRKNDVFVYDGLYNVTGYKQEKGAEGKMVFMFQLNRLPGQPPLHKMLNTNG